MRGAVSRTLRALASVKRAEPRVVHSFCDIVRWDGLKKCLSYKQSKYNFNKWIACNLSRMESKIKKIIRWGNGYAIYITQEAKKVGWNDKDYVRVRIAKDDKDRDCLQVTKVEE